MARTGVTYFDIAKAADAIKTSGQEPTVDRVREHLGTGSKSTIAPLLKRWRADNKGAADPKGLPDDLVDVVKSLHERVLQMADLKIDQAKKQFNSVAEKLHKELAEARNTIDQLTSHQDDLEQQLDTAEKEKRLLGKSLEDTRVAIAKCESQRDEAGSRVFELKETVKELKQENRDIRDHFEHYQRRTAEDRQLERAQFHTTNQQLQDQVEISTSKLTHAETQIVEQTKENTQHQAAINKLNTSNHSLQQEIGNKNAELKTLNDNVEASLSKNQELYLQNDLLREKLASLTAQQSAADKDVALLTQSLNKLESELRETKDKMALLVDENKSVLQEKAVIQGQLKQLQSAL
jgi:chromosome segregation ATPase